MLTKEGVRRWYIVHKWTSLISTLFVLIACITGLPLVFLFYVGNEPLSSRLFQPVIVNAWSGEMIAAPDMPWYITMLLLSQPLHFGDYGGLGLKIAWALLDVGMIIVLWSGLVLWWRKRAEMPEIDLVPSGAPA